MSGAMHLAEFNIGVLKHDWDDPRVADFVDNVDRVNALARRSPGFVWWMDDVAMEAAQTDPDGPLGGNPRTASTLSVWEDAASLAAFVFRTVHAQFYRRGAEWFEHSAGPRLVLWHVPAGHIPTIAEAAERLALLAAKGDTAGAFGWRWLKADGQDLRGSGPRGTGLQGSGLEVRQCA